MKPAPLPRVYRWRFIFARHLSLTHFLRRVVGWSGWVSVVGTAGFIAIACMAAVGVLGN